MKRLIITLGVVACITTPTCGQSKGHLQKRVDSIAQ